MKLFWIIRYLCYSLFFKQAGFISYLGRPISIVGINKIKIGKRVRIYPHVRLEVHGKNSELIIKDNVGISQNVHITCNGKLIISESTVIAANVFITNIDHDYTEIDVPILEQKHNLKETIIGANCFIGMGVAIQAGTILGKQCVIGTNSVVRGIFPDYCVIAGNPAKIIKKFNSQKKQWERVS